MIDFKVYFDYESFYNDVAKDFMEDLEVVKTQMNIEYIEEEHTLCVEDGAVYEVERYMVYEQNMKS